MSPLEVVASGVIETPQNRPIRIEFEYSNGTVLVLQDDALIHFWVMFLTITNIIRAGRMAQEQQQEGPIVTSESFLHREDNSRKG